MQKKRILLVDDEIGFTRLLKLNLEQTRRYEVRIENHADRALTAAREFRPHVVLLDIIMPKVIGHDVAEHLRADATLDEPSIVFLSAAAFHKIPDSRRPSLAPVPFIAKPASVEELIAGIENSLPQTKGEQI